VPYPFQIIQNKNYVLILNEYPGTFRIIPIDAAHGIDADPTWMGDSVGSWEGDTLVIDTISLDERTWINQSGWFHSDQVHVIERLRRPSMNYLEYQYTVEDAKVLTKPWTSAWRTYSLGKEDLTENFCTNNENVEQLEKLRDAGPGK